MAFSKASSLLPRLLKLSALFLSTSSDTRLLPSSSSTCLSSFSVMMGWSGSTTGAWISFSVLFVSFSATSCSCCSLPFFRSSLAFFCSRAPCSFATLRSCFSTAICTGHCCSSRSSESSCFSWCSWIDVSARFSFVRDTTRSVSCCILCRILSTIDAPSASVNLSIWALYISASLRNIRQRLRSRLGCR